MYFVLKKFIKGIVSKIYCLVMSHFFFIVVPIEKLLHVFIFCSYHNTIFSLLHLTRWTHLQPGHFYPCMDWLILVCFRISILRMLIEIISTCICIMVFLCMKPPNLNLLIGDWEAEGWQEHYYHKHVLQNYNYIFLNWHLTVWKKYYVYSRKYNLLFNCFLNMLFLLGLFIIKVT